MKKLIIITIIVLIGMLVFYTIKDVNDTSSKFNFDEKNLDSEDSLIIKKEMFKDIEVKKNAKSSLRNTIKFYRYKKLYNLYITKINLQKDISIDNVIHFNEEITSISSLITYMNLQSNSYYDIKFRAEKVEPISKLFSQWQVMVKN